MISLILRRHYNNLFGFISVFIFLFYSLLHTDIFDTDVDVHFYRLRKGKSGFILSFISNGFYQSKLYHFCSRSICIFGNFPISKRNKTKSNKTNKTKTKKNKKKNKKKKQTNKKTPTKQTKTHTLELYVYIVLCFLIMEKIEIKNTPHILKINTFIHVHVLGMYMGLCDKKM